LVIIFDYQTLDFTGESLLERLLHNNSMKDMLHNNSMKDIPELFLQNHSNNSMKDMLDKTSNTKSFE
jgi:hypothetical protein